MILGVRTNFADRRQIGSRQQWGFTLKIQLFGMLSGFALACSAPALAAFTVVEIAGGGGSQAFDTGMNGRAELSRVQPEGTASAYADLRTGKLGAGAVDFRPGTFAQASFGERLLITIPGATAETLTPISFAIKVDGTQGGDERSLNFMAVQYQFGQEGVGGEGAYLYLNVGSGITNSLETTCGIASLADFGVRGVCSFFLKGPTASVSINAILRAVAHNPSGTGIAYSDYTHTSTLGLRLPDGVTFASESGYFLTTAGVPEPATWAMLIIGFGAVGVMQRRRVASPSTVSA